MVIVILHSPFSEKATKGCHTFLHGETILLAPLYPHSPFSKNPISDLREDVTTLIVTRHDVLDTDVKSLDGKNCACVKIEV